tara:strand:- start:12 stop:446 length:435 start_codon:yes stop_codon:yes gene_type:complete
MKVDMIKLPGGVLTPANEAAVESLTAVKNNEYYTVDIKLNHNYKLLQKIHVFFKFCAQHYYGEKYVTAAQIELTREEITISAGYFEQRFYPCGVMFKVVPRSISYAKMSQEERGECYNRLVNAALINVFHTADENTFKQLMSFF